MGWNLPYIFTWPPQVLRQWVLPLRHDVTALQVLTQGALSITVTDSSSAQYTMSGTKKCPYYHVTWSWKKQLCEKHHWSDMVQILKKPDWVCLYSQSGPIAWYTFLYRAYVSHRQKKKKCTVICSLCFSDWSKVKKLLAKHVSSTLTGCKMLAWRICIV